MNLHTSKLNGLYYNDRIRGTHESMVVTESPVLTRQLDNRTN